MIARNLSRTLGALVVFFVTAAHAQSLTPAPKVTTPRLYVLDCGYVMSDTPEENGLTIKEVKDNLHSDPCFLVVHPKGTLLWETGLADRMVNRPVYENLRYKGHVHISLYKINTLVGQLADIGFLPDKITYLSMADHQYGHSGNANLFARSATWLVNKAEWAAMFGAKADEGFDDFRDLKSAKTVYVQDNHDVFGDGSVVIKEAFGHTPGHSVLQVKLKNTGTVILGGDLFTFQEERTLNRIGTAEQDKDAALKSRAKIEQLAKDSNAQLWLEQDVETYRTLRHAPGYYD